MANGFWRRAMQSTIDLRSNGMMEIHCPFEEKDLVKGLGALWDPPTKSWLLAFNKSNCDSLFKVFPNCRVSESLKSAYIEDEKILERIKAIKELCAKDEPYSLRVAGLKASLFNYQKLAVVHDLEGYPGFLLAAEMGTGKTVMAISMALMRKARGEIKNCLIVAPAAVKWNWEKEIRKFTDESVTIIDGKDDERIKLWLDDSSFFKVVNYDLLIRDLFPAAMPKINEKDDAKTIKRKRDAMKRQEEKLKTLEPIREKGFDFVIADEVHYIKTHDSNRTKCVKSIPAKYRLGLTGTPIDGKLEEIHSIMEWLKPGIFPRLPKFLDRHAIFDRFGRVVRYRHIDEVHDKISPVVLRQLKKDILKDLPDKIYKNVFVELSDKERKIYEAIKEGTHFSVFQNIDPEEIEESDSQQMVKAIRCAQLCDEPCLVGETSIKSSKFEALTELLQTIIRENGHKVVLFSRFKRMTDILCERLGGLGYNYLYICGDTSSKDRADYQEVFANDPSINMCIGTEAMSTGLNLVAADYVINYDDNWQPSIMLQREDRCHRVTTKGNVTVIDLICKDTIEERVRAVLKKKQGIADKVLGESRDDVVLEYKAINRDNVKEFI